MRAISVMRGLLVIFIFAVIVRGQTKGEDGDLDKPDDYYKDEKDHSMKSEGAYINDDQKDHSMKSEGAYINDDQKDHSMKSEGAYINDDQKDHSMKSEGAYINDNEKDHSMKSEGAYINDDRQHDANRRHGTTRRHGGMKSGYSRGYGNLKSQGPPGTLKGSTKYQKYYKSKYGKIMGHCKVTPEWKWDSKEQPILDSTKMGNIVVLFLTKSTSQFCRQELYRLNDLAKTYHKRRSAVSFVVLNKRNYPDLPKKYAQKFPMLRFYEEPESADVFDQMKAWYGNILIFDKCGRVQYDLIYPFSSLLNNFVKQGIENTFDHADLLCGACEPKIVGPDLSPDPTDAPTAAEESTFAPTTLNNVETGDLETTPKVATAAGPNVLFKNKKLLKN